MNNAEEQKSKTIRPKEWAENHGVESAFVVRLLREANVEVRSHVSLIPLESFKSIEKLVEAEKAKSNSRHLVKDAKTFDQESSPRKEKKKEKSKKISTIKGVKVSITRRNTTKTEAASKIKVSEKALEKTKEKDSLVVKTPKPIEENIPKKQVEPVLKEEAKLEKKPNEVTKESNASKKEVALDEKSVETSKPAETNIKTTDAVQIKKKEVEATREEKTPDNFTKEAAKKLPETTEKTSKDSTPLLGNRPLKVPAMKAQVFKPDADILARIEKSKQQEQERVKQRRNHNNSRRSPNNKQGYTGSFSGSTARPHTSGSKPTTTQKRPYTTGGPARQGFSSGSMQEAFGASPKGADLVATTARTGHKPAGGRRNDKKRNIPTVNKEERQKEQQEAVRQNVSRVMASLSKHPVKKVYRKEHAEADGAVEKKILKTSDFITVGELAGLMEQMPARVIAKCMEMGLMVTINARLDFESIQILADEFGFEAKLMEEYEEEMLGLEEESSENLKPRHPVVTVMGHVDHGKTSLLDWIRKANVVVGESGGITQHIGAYEVSTKEGKVTFLDTPGHEAFSAMRARGSQVTDVIVLVVAADSMVMPQTVESIELARREKVPIVVAITKVDLPTANPDKIRAQLAERGVEVSQWGGDVSSIEVSARTGQGMDTLLETLALEAEVLELKANPDSRARGAVVESKLDVGKGSTATILIQSGTLKVGDPFVCGIYSGRVRAMFDERGQVRKEAGPSTPCQVLGFDGTPQAGDDLIVVEDEKSAREIASNRRMAARERDLRARKTMSLENVYEGVKDGKVSELNIIVKADVGGSTEALAASLEALTNSEVKINIIRKAVGAITDSDVLLASSANAIIVAFHLMPSYSIREMAEKEGVEIKTYRVIYDCIEDIKNAVEGLLKPTLREEIIGEAEIREVFKIPKIGLIAGCMVTSGEVSRSSRVHVYRDGVELGLTEVQSLKRHKDDVKTVARGFECGIGLRGYENIQEGDTLMFFKDIKIARTLEDVARDEKIALEKKKAEEAKAEAKENKKEEA